MKLGIIGTAGRKPDGDKITEKVWKESKNVFWFWFQKLRQTYPIDTVVSGGAAFYDSFAPSIYLAGHVPNCNLHLPAPFDMEFGAFYETSKTGEISNYYHKKFAAFGINGLKDLKLAIEKGANAKYYDGFFVRNNIVASESDILIAFTFGDGPVLKDGGTAHTMSRFIKEKGNKNAFHVDLNTLKLYSEAVVKK